MSIAPRGKLFRDPVHGLIRIENADAVVLDLIGTPEFQRLRRIRQLGVSSMVFPGAEHSRFVHSLGVYNFAQRMLDCLIRRYQGTEAAMLLKSNARFVKVAALLHDIGHGPFSHLSEKAFEEPGHHEKRTANLIRNSDSAIYKILQRYDLDPISVADLIEHVTSYPLLADFISSQLDADRMDYILRDALNTGVKYGSFDVEWLLNSLCIGSEPGNPTHGDSSTWRLCLEDRRGLYSAEQFVVARMHMSLQVYFHRVTIAWETHLVSILLLATQLARENQLPLSTPMAAKRFFAAPFGQPYEKFIGVDDNVVISAMQAWAETEAAANSPQARLASLSKDFLQRRKRFHCMELLPSKHGSTLKLAKELTKIGVERENWLLYDVDFTSYKDYDAVFRRTDADDTDDTEAILLSSGELGDRARPAEIDSTILKALADSNRHSISGFLFCEADIFDEASAFAKKLNLIKK